MTMTLFSLALVLLIAYLWSLRGFFSALIHLACTIAAGAIAFGVWEPLAYLILDNTPHDNWMRFIHESAWAIGLLVPFGVSLIALRAIIDGLLPANTQVDKLTDLLGGGALGAASGVLSVGLLVFALGFVRIAPDSQFAFKGADYSSGAQGRGSVERTNEFFSPHVDRIAVRFFTFLSKRAFSTPEPLAKWHPEADVLPTTLRMGFNGTARNTLRRADFEIPLRYVVGDPAKSEPLARVMEGQTAVDLSGQPLSNGHLAGFVVRFRPGAKERQGQTVIGNAQVRLVAQSQDGTNWIVRHPVAVITNEAIEAPTPSGGSQPGQPLPEATNQMRFARFKFEQQETFLASVGGAAEAVMAFEFPLPPGYRPIALYIRGARYNVPQTDDPKAVRQFANGPSRDANIRGALLQLGMGGSIDQAGAVDVASMNTSQATRVETRTPQQGGQPGVTPDTGIQITNSLGFVIQKGGERTMTVEEAPNRRGYVLVDGTERFSFEELSRGNQIDFKLRIDRIAAADGVVILRTRSGVDARASLLHPVFTAADRKEVPVLVDTTGRRYQPVGYVARDQGTQIQHVRYTPGRPIESLQELDQVGLAPSISKPNQTLELIFRVDLGSQIKYFGIGDKAAFEYVPPIPADRPQR